MIVCADKSTRMIAVFENSLVRIFRHFDRELPMYGTVVQHCSKSTLHTEQECRSQRIETTPYFLYPLLRLSLEFTVNANFSLYTFNRPHLSI